MRTRPMRVEQLERRLVLSSTAGVELAADGRVIVDVGSTNGWVVTFSYDGIDTTSGCATVYESGAAEIAGTSLAAQCWETSAPLDLWLRVRGVEFPVFEAAAPYGRDPETGEPYSSDDIGAPEPPVQDSPDDEVPTEEQPALPPASALWELPATREDAQLPLDSGAGEETGNAPEDDIALSNPEAPLPATPTEPSLVDADPGTGEEADPAVADPFDDPTWTLF